MCTDVIQIYNTPDLHSFTSLTNYLHHNENCDVYLVQIHSVCDKLDIPVSQ